MTTWSSNCALLTAERGEVDDVFKFCQAKAAANDPAHR